ncbi:MAG: KH domain-containing protein [Fidelibacterota bacterium]
MKDFIEYIAKRLVDKPEEVKVTQIDSEKTVIYELQVAEGDLGKVIGKKGRTAKSIRTLLSAAAAKEGGKKAILEIIE